MLVSSPTHLIPYEQRQYPVQAFIPDNRLIIQDMGRNAIERRNRFQFPLADKLDDAILLNDGGHRYDRTLFLQYSDDDQVGLLVDLYA